MTNENVQKSLHHQIQVWIVNIFTWFMKFTWLAGTLEGQWNAQVKAWEVLAGPDMTRWWASWTMRSRGAARVDELDEELVERFLELERARWWVWAGSIRASYVANIDPDWLLDRKSKNSEISTTPPCFMFYILYLLCYKGSPKPLTIRTENPTKIQVCWSLNCEPQN